MRMAGEAGLRWLASLPALADRLAARWELSLGSVLGGGTEALVLEAWMAGGQPVVLKLSPPGADPAGDELRTLLAAQGRGYVLVHRHDAAVGALLLERLGGQLVQTGWPLSDQLAALCATLREAWTAPPPEGLTNGAEKARALAEFISATWNELDRPCSGRVVETALGYARQREAAFDPAQALLAHGDAHGWNTLQAADGRFKLVDPDGLLIEPAYDLGIPMREWTTELLAGDPLALGRERAELLSPLPGVPPEPIWQWGFIERVSTALLCQKLGLEGGAQMLAVAEAWAAP